MEVNKNLKEIKIKNRDILLSYLRRNSKGNLPIYYENIEKDLGITKDYLCQLLKPLKKAGVIKIDNLDQDDDLNYRKGIYFTEFGKTVVNGIRDLWITAEESQRIRFFDIYSDRLRELQKTDTELFQDLLLFMKEDIKDLVRAHIAPYIESSCLLAVLTEDLYQDIYEWVSQTKVIFSKENKENEIIEIKN